MNKKIINSLTLLSFLIMIVINIFVTTNLLNTDTIRDISNLYPNLLMPINLIFSLMWTIIYILEFIYIMYTLLKDNERLTKKISIYVMFINLLNAIWLLLFLNKYMLLVLFVIVAMLVCLYEINSITQNNDLTITKLTFGIYYGWIFMALIINLFTYLVFSNATTFDSTFLQVLVIIALLSIIINVCI